MTQKIKCPKCNWVPNQEYYWLCTCGQTWNTFSTYGVCPNCSKNWNITMCLSCGQYSAHSEWYQNSNYILKYILKNHFYAMLLNLELGVNIILDELNILTKEQIVATLLFLKDKGLIQLNNASIDVRHWTFVYVGNLNPPIDQLHEFYVDTSKVISTGDNTSIFLQTGEVGLLDIDCPTSMLQGVQSEVKTSIKRFNEILESQSGTKIPIKPVMSVRLIGEDFSILELNSTEQIIDIHSDIPTVWNWRVKPLKYGIKAIELLVSMKVNLDNYGTRTKDLPIYKRKIEVKVNRAYTFKIFLEKNWQWIVGTVIGSGVLWQIIKAFKVF